MAKITATQNTSDQNQDPIVLSTSTTGQLKRAVNATALTPTGSDYPAAAQMVGTHVDDAAFTAATDALVAIAGLADETATDSVDEGDIGALRMTLNRRLITAALLLDDAAFGVATDYVTPIAGFADDTSADSVNEGDVGVVRMSLARALHVVNVADTATVSTLASAATSATLLAANANRIGVTIHNSDANALYVKYGATATTTTSYTVKIAADGYWEMPQPIYRGVLDGIWSADGAGSAQITELT